MVKMRLLYKFQSSNSEVTVYWERFIDIEELGTYVHASGISHYMVALGMTINIYMFPLSQASH